MSKVKAFFTKIWERVKACFGWKSALFLGIFAVLLAIDLITKHFEEQDGWRFTVIPGFIEVVSGIKNTGASLGIGEGQRWAFILFVTLTFIIVPVIFCTILLLPERFAVLKFSLNMINAGAIGNLVDRLALGYVRDFIGMDFGFFGFYCNFADIWLVVGIIIVIIDFLFLNECAVFPLTKRAKEAAAARREKEEEEKRAKELSFKASSDGTKSDTQPGADNCEKDGTNDGGGESGDV